MSPGRPLLALALVAAGVGIGVPLLSNSLHKLSAQGWFHPNATKGGLIQPATPTPHTTPVTGLLQPPTPAPAPAASPPPPLPTLTPPRPTAAATAGSLTTPRLTGSRHAIPHPAPDRMLAPEQGIGRSQAGCCPPRPCVR